MIEKNITNENIKVNIIFLLWIKTANGISEEAISGLDKKHNMPKNINKHKIKDAKIATEFCFFTVKFWPDLIITKDAKNTFWNAYKKVSGDNNKGLLKPNDCAKFRLLIPLKELIIIKTTIKGTIK